MSRVLVVEDDEDLRTAVAVELRAAGFDVDEAGDVASADTAFARDAYDCAVFDRKLPDGDSLGYVAERRRTGWTVPVLFLTGHAGVADRVAGFESGADDYLGKPFAVAELTARVHALCRRPATRPPLLRVADLEVDTARHEARRGGTTLALSAREFAVLEFLISRPGRAVARADLVEHCWDTAADPMSNVVDVVIRRIRRKLGEPDLVHAVRGLGYRLGAPA
ncbi:response regulator transcription factor [Amycolatopsis sp. NBC_01286]|uniref:response regulator transcription factor n=1 Tax=Amycolatopsis sp. NBC_01286 TaxID=2903560 RepID=UPI002E12CE67|nr:response regulator transcription factor [Amycolatopsis sp. NBC_01286]